VTRPQGQSTSASTVRVTPPSTRSLHSFQDEVSHDVIVTVVRMCLQPLAVSAHPNYT
jgi:hypothetical protein